MPTPELVIARIDPGTRQKDVSRDTVTLFFPHTPANRGRIVCWSRIGQHAEASLDYYHTTRKPKTGIEIYAADAAVMQWKYETQSTAKRMQRLPHDFRQFAWER